MGVYHAGERAVQERAGVRRMSDRVANGVHTAIPEAAAAFLTERRFVIVGWADDQGRIWASLLHGPFGFAHAMGTAGVRLTAATAPSDPLSDRLRRMDESGESLAVGLLAIDPATRRRMRINGPAAVRNVEGEASLLIRADQVYANCPKYIQRRVPEANEPEADSAFPSLALVSDGLTTTQREWVASADTFFIATAHPESGADASHRGGNPGFVRVADEGRTLTWPDYAGNAMFNTLGNIASHPATGLLFLDFERGGMLQITGQAKVLWEEDAVRATGSLEAERAVRFTVAQAIEHPAGTLPLRLRLTDYSPFNPEVGPAPGQDAS